MEKQESCRDRVQDSFDSRKNELTILWNAYCKGSENAYVEHRLHNLSIELENVGNIFEYGLCFDYVAPNTFNDQKEDYYRYQLSYGGPSEEFRFYVNRDDSVRKIEYWFLDWFDGACIDVTEDRLINELWDWFADMGLPTG